MVTATVKVVMHVIHVFEYAIDIYSVSGCPIAAMGKLLGGDSRRRSSKSTVVCPVRVLIIFYYIKYQDILS
jgi:hypothetical protein